MSIARFQSRPWVGEKRRIGGGNEYSSHCWSFPRQPFPLMMWPCPKLLKSHQICHSRFYVKWETSLKGCPLPASGWMPSFTGSPQQFRKKHECVTQKTCVHGTAWSGLQRQNWKLNFNGCQISGKKFSQMISQPGSLMFLSLHLVSQPPCASL